MSTKRKTTEEFVKDAKEVHGDKYIYTKVIYKNQHTPVCIICPKHGEFWQKPKNHLKGHGCYECAKLKFGKFKRTHNKQTYKEKLDSNISDFTDIHKGERLTYETFLKYAKEVHGDKYIYTKVIYKNRKEKVCIICPEHGEFWQSPSQHLKGHGCHKCAKKITAEKQKITKDIFIKFANEKYNNKYVYTKINYIDYNNKICIICPEHGEFWQSPKQHLLACGCKGCVSEKKSKNFSMTKEEFVKRSRKIFNEKYIYDNVNYKNNCTKVSITCPKHGDFLCTPANHLKGRGCPICNSENYVYESRMLYFLKTIFDEEDIIIQYKDVWLTNNKSLDFYIPKFKIAIEHQGSQHFKPLEFFGGMKKYKRCVELDKEKYNECVHNNVTLFYFTYEPLKISEYIDKVYTKEDDLKQEIIKILNRKNEKNYWY